MVASIPSAVWETKARRLPSGDSSVSPSISGRTCAGAMGGREIFDCVSPCRATCATWIFAGRISSVRTSPATASSVPIWAPTAGGAPRPRGTPRPRGRPRAGRRRRRRRAAGHPSISGRPPRGRGLEEGPAGRALADHPQRTGGGGGLQRPAVHGGAVAGGEVEPRGERRGQPSPGEAGEGNPLRARRRGASSCAHHRASAAETAWRREATPSDLISTRGNSHNGGSGHMGEPDSVIDTLLPRVPERGIHSRTLHSSADAKVVLSPSRPLRS